MGHAYRFQTNSRRPACLGGLFTLFAARLFFSLPRPSIYLFNQTPGSFAVWFSRPRVVRLRFSTRGSQALTRTLLFACCRSRIRPLFLNLRAWVRDLLVSRRPFRLREIFRVHDAIQAE